MRNLLCDNSRFPSRRPTRFHVSVHITLVMAPLSMNAVTRTTSPVVLWISIPLRNGFVSDLLSSTVANGFPTVYKSEISIISESVLVTCVGDVNGYVDTGNPICSSSGGGLTHLRTCASLLNLGTTRWARFRVVLTSFPGCEPALLVGTRRGTSSFRSSRRDSRCSGCGRG